MGVLPTYYRNFSVPPADQRARLVLRDYQRKAVECDRSWNGMTTGSVGAFEGYLASLPAVIGPGFRGCGEWSRADTLIGEIAERASAVPERRGCWHGPMQPPGRCAPWARTQLHRVTLREVSRCRHAALDHMLRRPSETYAGDPEDCRAADDSPDSPGITNAKDTPVSEKHPGPLLPVAPKRLRGGLARGSLGRFVQMNMK